MFFPSSLQIPQQIHATEYFWNSSDGQILSVKSKDPNTLSLVLAFWPRNPAELEFIRARLNEIHFTERSTLARIGIEMITPGVPRVDHNRLILETDAFLFDPSFPNAPYWKKLLRPARPSAGCSMRPNRPSWPPTKSGRR